MVYNREGSGMAKIKIRSSYQLHFPMTIDTLKNAGAFFLGTMIVRP